MKRQNKEQVPPPTVDPKKPANNKKQQKKVAAVTNQNQKQGRFRSLEEAMKAVSVPRHEVWKDQRLEYQRRWGQAVEGPVGFGILLVRRSSGKEENPKEM